MGFDASGNFTRVYNFQQDAANGIKILAARVDGEFDNVATGMNLVFFRDGRVPMQADLRMNINGITGLKDGALGTPAIKFNTDPNTGPYLDGLNRYGVQVNSVQRGVFTTAGLDVIGNLTASGAIVESGVALASKYAQIAGTTFTAGVNGTYFNVAGANGAYYLQPRDGTTGATMLYSDTLNSLRIQQNSADQWILSPSRLTIVPSVSISNNLTVGTNAVTGFAAMNGPSGSTSRGMFLQTAGVNQASIALQGDNTTIRYDTTGGAHAMQVSGTTRLAVNSGGATVTGTFQAGDILASRGDGTGVLYFGATGTNNYIYWDGTRYNMPGLGGVAANAGGFAALGTVAGSSYSAGFSHNRSGQVGYHLANNGGVAEWMIYQPASATSNEFRIGSAAAGTITDRFKIATNGDITVPGKLTTNDHCTSRGDGTGAIYFGSFGSSRYLWYDGTNFQLSASLIVGGNISSSSDARLKSNVRDMPNGMEMVRALQPKRFTMYGKNDFGFIAQEALPVVPEVVSVDAKGYMSIDYGRMTAVLASAIKNLDERLTRAGL